MGETLCHVAEVEPTNGSYVMQHEQTCGWVSAAAQQGPALRGCFQSKQKAYLR